MPIVPGPLSATPKSIDLPEIGDSAGSVISPTEERRIGEALMRSLRQTVRIQDDPQITGYIKSLGYRLVANSDNQAQQFTFIVIDEPDINAFAAPGGFIGINRGLILASKTESELASVIAHEIAHITQRHMARAFEFSRKLSLSNMVALLAAIIISTQNSEAGQAAIAAAQAGTVQTQLNFTRSNEEEADNVGIRTLARAGFDPRSMPVFFERLQNAIKFYGAEAPDFLRTHPVTVSRIADSRDRAEQYSYRQYHESLDYHLVRSRLRVLECRDPSLCVRSFRTTLENGKYRNESAERYGYILALLRDGKTTTARTELNKLTGGGNTHIAYRILQAEIETAAGNTRDAEAIYMSALKLYPHNHSLTIHLAQTLLRSGQAAKARDLLEEHIRHRGTEPRLQKLLAIAHGDAGQRAAAHAAMAEYHYLNGETGAAIEQLQLAQDQKTSDYYLSARIAARMREFQEELKKDIVPQ